MRKTSVLGVALPLLGLMWSGASVFGQGAKIGFVNSQEILFRTNEGSEGLQQLETYMTQKRAEFDAKNKELADLQQELQTKRPTLSPEAASELQRKIDQKQVELRRFQEDLQADLNDRQNGLLERISQKVQQVIQEYAQQNGYDIVFVRDQTQAYVAPQLDVTQDIIKLYNERFPGKGGAAAAPAPSN